MGAASSVNKVTIENGSRDYMYIIIHTVCTRISRISKSLKLRSTIMNVHVHVFYVVIWSQN